MSAVSRCLSLWYTARCRFSAGSSSRFLEVEILFWCLVEILVGRIVKFVRVVWNVVFMSQWEKKKMLKNVETALIKMSLLLLSDARRKKQKTEKQL